MFASNFLEEGFLNTMRGIAFAAPARVFCALFLSSPGETGRDGIEISYNGYMRMEIKFDPPTPESSGIGMRNNEQVTFSQSDIDAGTVMHIGIFDSPTPGGGNMYLYGELSEPLPVMQGESPVLLLDEILYFSVGDLSTEYKRRLFNIVRGLSLSGFEPHLSLWSGNPESGGAELSGLNYERVPLEFSAPVHEVNGVTVIRNTVQADFNRPTTNWGNWVVTAVMDSKNGGHPVWTQPRTPARMVNRGIMPFAEVNAITVGVN